MSTAATQSITVVQPYLYFQGRTEEAIELYKEVLGAKVTMMMRFSDSPEPCSPEMVPPGTEHKVMHAEFQVGPTTIMASDGGCGDGQAAEFKGISLSISTDTPEEAERIFNELGLGGQVIMPLMKTFFSPKFGMFTDRFGVMWLVVTNDPAHTR